MFHEDNDENVLKAKFDLSRGSGTPLGTHHAMQTTSTRGAVGRKFEVALEPLHRFVYGRPGHLGERREALAQFCGFPEEMKDDIALRLAKLTKNQLYDLAAALNMKVMRHTLHATMAQEVAAFLMHPVDNPVAQSTGKAKRAPTARGKVKVSKKGNVASPKKTAVAKRAPRKTTVAREPNVDPPTVGIEPSDDTLRLAIYRHILKTPATERSQLTTKVLRLELQKTLGDLESRKAVIKEAASECVTALVAAEKLAIATAMGPSQSTVEVVATTENPLHLQPLPQASTVEVNETYVTSETPVV
ncbi:hypothetical protein ERJ75_001005600 [Trypanosoma vivax]|uniref:Uncharacterized protein n=1 Tax=Trypanosoma vivax (strain Y486) TaxID=1055687 RepID=G0TYH8_TRYVY|nr:hypothetical protein ERJ75_001005600 [Trypanosoma vivax]CCC49025.1 conserved hypothetical protein [Trypanosoma vivax Y486]